MTLIIVNPKNNCAIEFAVRRIWKTITLTSNNVPVINTVGLIIAGGGEGYRLLPKTFKSSSWIATRKRRASSLSVRYENTTRFPHRLLIYELQEDRPCYVYRPPPPPPIRWPDLRCVQQLPAIVQATCNASVVTRTFVCDVVYTVRRACMEERGTSKDEPS